MDQKARLAVNTVSNLAGLVVTATIGFLLAPYILDHIGKSAYGVWALIGSVFAYSKLLTLGLNSAVNRWIPMYLVQRDVEGINRVVNTTLASYLLAGGALFAAVLALSFQFPAWFSVPEELHVESRTAVAVVGAGFVLMVLTNVFPAILSGLQRYDLIFVADILTDVSRAAVLFVILPMGYGLVAVAAVAASAVFVRGGVKGYLALRGMPELRLDLRLARLATFREMLGYSINTFLYACGEIIQAQTALILVGLLLDASMVPEYSMPLIITATMGRVVTAGSAAIKPAATHLDASNRSDQVRLIYLAGTKYALLIILPIASFLFVHGGALLRVWLGENFMESGPQILAVLTLGAAFRLWHIPAFYVVVGLGKHRQFGILTLATGLLSVVLAVLLHVFSDLGIFGLAIAFAGSEALAALLFVTPYCCGTIGITVWQELRASLVPASIAMLPYWLALGLGASHFSPTSYAELGLLVALLGLVVAGGVWTFGLSAVEKARFRGLLRRR